MNREIQYFAAAIVFVLTMHLSCVNANTGRENTQVFIDGFAPKELRYTENPLKFFENITVTPAVPETAARRGLTRCTSSPALPAGLVVDNATCAISGTPTTLQAPVTYTITGSNDFGTATTEISIEIRSPPPSNLIYAGSPYAFVKNATISRVTPTFTGAITSCTVSPALPGLTLNNTTCEITGAPTTSQLQTTHTITASNAEGSTSTTIDLTIFRVIFVGGARGGSNIANSGVADADCNIVTGNHPGYGTYKAMIVGWGTRRACSSSNCSTSGAAENLDWVLAPDTEYRRTDAVTKVITTNSSGVGSIVAAFIASGVTAHWSGLTTDWRTQGATGTCGGSWSTGATSGAYGRTNSAGGIALFDALASPCSSNSNRLICAQQ